MTPVDWAAVATAVFGIVTGSVKWLIPGIRALQQPAQSHGAGNGGINGATKAIEARIEAAETATILASVNESHRVIDAVFEIVGAHSRATDRATVVLERLAELANKGDARWTAITESTEAINRMLQLHTGLLDRSAVQVDALYAQTQPPPKKRRKS